MEHPHNTNNARDLAIGFFGWLLVWNLILLIFLLSYYGSFWTIGILMIIGMGLPFLYKRNWLGYGVVTCVIINMVAWIAIAKSNFQMYMIVTPFPMGILFM